VAASAFRRLDRRWSRAPDVYVANSTFVADRIERAYGRSSVVIHPPIDTELWCPGPEPKDDFFLVAGRLVGYKMPMIAVEAARRIGARVVVAGDGPVLKEIEQLSDPAVQIVKSPSDETLRDLYRRARALVFPGVEDFGMTLLEAQACATPVVARAAGGALDSVVDGVTGVFVRDGSVDAFAEALREFDAASFDRSVIRKHAERFGTDRFLREMDDLVERQLSSSSSVERGA
jgi:glycosyltransferase involved in cell wall biosynthesis